MLWCIFSCAYLPSVYLWYLLKSLAYFLIRLFYCCLQTSLYILDNMSFANIFCQFVVCLLILLMSFTKQKFIILMKFSLSVVSFMDHAFDFVTWEVIAIFKSCRFSLRLSFRILKILSFTFWFMIHFELIDVNVGRSVSRVIFFFLHADVLLFQYCLRRLSSLILSLLLCQRSVGFIWILFVGSLVCSLDLLVYSCNSTALFWLL